MKYLEFTIHKYKAIDKDLTVKLEKNRLTPIIGINECGKTTILHAIFAFDFYNDVFNEKIHHLDDVKNLYKPGQKQKAEISAKIQISWNEFLEVLKQEDIKTLDGIAAYKRKKENFHDEIIIARDLINKEYDIKSDLFQKKNTNNEIAKAIIRQLPYILYFDDFRDSFPDKIEIEQNEKDNPKGWLAIIDRLFEKTNEDFSIFSLSEMDERERNSIISQVQKKLNDTLTEEWKKFSLDEKKALKISISFSPQSTGINNEIKNASIKFDVLETDKDGNDHYFYIRDRSKGLKCTP